MLFSSMGFICAGFANFNFANFEFFFIISAHSVYKGSFWQIWIKKLQSDLLDLKIFILVLFSQIIVFPFFFILNVKKTFGIFW